MDKSPSNVSSNSNPSSSFPNPNHYPLHIDHPETNVQRTKAPTSPLTHILILSSILLPVAILPYLAIRRQLISLNRKITEVGIMNATLQRDLKTALLEASIRREEHDRLHALLKESKDRMQNLEIGMERREVTRQQYEADVRMELKQLRRGYTHARTQLGALQELGTSLADVAAFMHEVEIQQGLSSRKSDGRGIEKIRQLAVKLRNLPSENATSEQSDRSS